MKNRYFITYGLVIVGLFLFWGCSAGSFTAPSGSTITMNPSSVTITSLSGDVIQNFSVTVKDKDGKLSNKAQLFISGQAAAPRIPSRYQFYRGVNGNTPVDGGFTAETDNFGIYNFSIKIPALVDGTTNSFKDNIEITSGGAFVSVSVTLGE